MGESSTVIGLCLFAQFFIVFYCLSSMGWSEKNNNKGFICGKTAETNQQIPETWNNDKKIVSQSLMRKAINQW